MKLLALAPLALAILLHALPVRADTADTVKLKAGGAAQGKLVELVPNAHVDIELSPGKVMSFRWDEIDDVTRGVTGEAALGIVELHDGRLHGTITEISLNDHVTIELPSGQERVIPWVDVVRLQSGERVPPPPPPKNVPRTTEPTTVVTIDAPSAMRLYRMSKYGNVDELCIAPCNEEVPTSGEFWVSGTENHTSNHFQLSGARARVVVSGGNKSTATAGMIMAGMGGGMVFVVSPLIWAMGAAAASAPYHSPGETTTATILGTAGVITGVGTLFGLVGLGFWLFNTSSHAEVE